MILITRHILPLIFLAALTACSDGAQDVERQTEARPQTNEVTSRKPQTQTPQFRTIDVDPAAAPLVSAARDRLKALVIYDGRYVGLDYPGGDVPANIGVCTDVVIRSYRAAHGFDLQKAVHEDMRASFSDYPTTWGLTRPDKNIDHRRVPNLETWFTRKGYDLPITDRRADYRPGDVVSWRLANGAGRSSLPHIGIVTERLSSSGTPLIIHNIGRGPEESDMLFAYPITGHFRFAPRTHSDIE